MADVENQERRFSRAHLAQTIGNRLGEHVPPDLLDDREYSASEAAEVVSGFVSARNAFRAAAAVQAEPEPEPEPEPILLTEADRIHPVDRTMFVAGPTDADLRVQAELEKLRAKPVAIAEAEISVPPSVDVDDAKDWRVMTVAERNAERDAFVRQWGVRAWRERLEALDELGNAVFLEQLKRRKARR